MFLNAIQLSTPTVVYFVTLTTVYLSVFRLHWEFYQPTMESRLYNILHVIVYLDDVLISG